MSESMHRKIGELIPGEIFNQIFLFGNFAKFIAYGAIKKGFPAERIHINDDIDKPCISALQIKQSCPPGELILLKGSRGVRVERILDCFKEGGISD